MNKFLVIAILACCSLAFVSAENGGFHPAEYIEEYHAPILKAAVEHLTKSNLVSQNGLYQVEGFYEKIVSGNIYKFVIRFDAQVYEIELWSQPWLHKLEVQSVKLVQSVN